MKIYLVMMAEYGVHVAQCYFLEENDAQDYINKSFVDPKKYEVWIKECKPGELI